MFLITIRGGFAFFPSLIVTIEKSLDSMHLRRFEEVVIGTRIAERRA